MNHELTVILPVFDGSQTVEAAVRSVLCEHEVPLRLRVIDDGSTDGTAERVRAIGDPRLELERHDANRGLVVRLNDAYRQVETPFVARMDADDIALPGRFAAQLRCLREHPEIDLVGTSVDLFNDTGEAIAEDGARPPTHATIRWTLYFDSPIAHPTWCARTAALARGGPLDPDFRSAEDYEFLCRNRDVRRFANLPQPLVRMRRHAGSVSHRRQPEQQDATVRAVQRMLRDEIGCDVPFAEAHALSYPWISRDPEALAAAIAWLGEIERHELARPGLSTHDAAWIRRDATRRLRALRLFLVRRAPAQAPAMLWPWLARERFDAPRSVVETVRRHLARRRRARGR